MHNFESLMDGDATRTQNVPRRRQVDLEEKLAPPWSSDPSPLKRSAYERVFLKLGSGSPLKIGDEILTPVRVKGWYHSIFRTASGEERMLSIDQLLEHMGCWLA